MCLSHIHKCEWVWELREYCVNECERARPTAQIVGPGCELVQKKGARDNTGYCAHSAYLVQRFELCYNVRIVHANTL